jgi:hypothetical protein
LSYPVGRLEYYVVTEDESLNYCLDKYFSQLVGNVSRILEYSEYFRPYNSNICSFYVVYTHKKEKKKVIF